MYKLINLEESNEEAQKIAEKQKEISEKIWKLLVPLNKTYDVFYDIRAYVPYQQELADMVPDIREYCTYETETNTKTNAWIIELKNTIYRNTKIEHYKFECLNEDKDKDKDNDILYLCIDNVKCRIYFSFAKKLI